MNLSLTELGALGEFLGALAVIASVLYLAAQIRHSVRASEGAAVQNVTAQFSSMQFEMARDAALSELLWRARQGGELTPVETVRVGELLAAYLIAFENLFVQQQQGLLGYDAFADREGVVAWVLGSPFARRWWTEIGSGNHPRAFVDEVNRILRDTDAAHPPAAVESTP